MNQAVTIEETAGSTNFFTGSLIAEEPNWAAVAQSADDLHQHVIALAAQEYDAHFELSTTTIEQVIKVLQLSLRA